MKFTTAFSLIFACLVASSVFIEQVEAGKKKKLILGALLLAALAKPKILPLPIPIPIPIKFKVTKHEPRYYPVYEQRGYGGGYGESNAPKSSFDFQNVRANNSLFNIDGDFTGKDINMTYSSNSSPKHQTGLDNVLFNNKIMKVGDVNLSNVNQPTVNKDDLSNTKQPELTRTEVIPCFVLCILSHGNEKREFYCYDDPLSYSEVLEYFNVSSLTGKPKLFFIQACQGDKTDRGVLVSSDAVSSASVPSNNKLFNDGPNLLPTTADRFIFYSSYAEYYSYRSATNGSLFIQTLVNVFDEDALQFDLETMCNKVKDQVANINGTTGDSSNQIIKQMPTVQTTLRKGFRFYN
ncbi:Caspase-7 [Tyrophagus putrescentiae]|nr:Caspase-7 [Tyrophagus putrescentiae]